MDVYFISRENSLGVQNCLFIPEIRQVYYTTNLPHPHRDYSGTSLGWSRYDRLYNLDTDRWNEISSSIKYSWFQPISYSDSILNKIARDGRSFKLIKT